MQSMSAYQEQRDCAEACDARSEDEHLTQRPARVFCRGVLSRLLWVHSSDHEPYPGDVHAGGAYPTGCQSVHGVREESDEKSYGTPEYRGCDQPKLSPRVRGTVSKTVDLGLA